MGREGASCCRTARRWRDEVGPPPALSYPGVVNLGFVSAQGLAVLGLEPSGGAAAGPLRARLRARGRDGAPHPQAGDPGLLGALLNGLVGVLSEPMR